MHLTVPTSLAGVTGPCPGCQVLIQAPEIVSPPFPVSSRTPLIHVTPPEEQNHPPPREIPATPVEQPALVRPEPRQLPNRSDSPEPPPRVRPEPSGNVRPLSEGAQPPVRQHRSRLLRVAVPLAFLCLALGLMYGVNKLLKIDRANPPGKASAVAATAAPDLLPDSDALQGDTFESLTDTRQPDVLPVGVQETSPPSTPTPGVQPVDGGIAALRLLEEFLAMSTLEQRLPHLESRLPEEKLASSVLSSPLPEIRNISVDIRETNSIEDVIDYYYHVDFVSVGESISPQTMLVRTRGLAPPKVVVDPFLDLYGGRFARYAAEPSKDAATFQVVVSAGAFCYDDVPGADKKFTLKILSREDTKEIDKAYFGKRSKIGYLLSDLSSGLAYGQAKACTVFMRWNLDEDPERPFLEALDITSLDWNP